MDLVYLALAALMGVLVWGLAVGCARLQPRGEKR